MEYLKLKSKTSSFLLEKEKKKIKKAKTKAADTKKSSGKLKEFSSSLTQFKITDTDNSNSATTTNTQDENNRTSWTCNTNSDTKVTAITMDTTNSIASLPVIETMEKESDNILQKPEPEPVAKPEITLHKIHSNSNLELTIKKVQSESEFQSDNKESMMKQKHEIKPESDPNPKSAEPELEPEAVMKAEQSQQSPHALCNSIHDESNNITEKNTSLAADISTLVNSAKTGNVLQNSNLELNIDTKINACTNDNNLSNSAEPGRPLQNAIKVDENNNGVHKPNEKEYEHLYLDTMPSAPIKSDSEVEDAEIVPTSKSKASCKSRYENNTDKTIETTVKPLALISCNSRLESPRSMPIPMKLISTNLIKPLKPELKENVSPHEIEIERNRNMLEFQFQSQLQQQQYPKVPTEILKIRPFNTSFSKTSAFLKIKSSTISNSNQCQKPLKPKPTNKNLSSEILNSYPCNYNSSYSKNIREKIPLKISWEQLAQDFDLDDIDDLDDDAITSIQYYNMILREDLLPPRNHDNENPNSNDSKSNAQADQNEEHNPEAICSSLKSNSELKSRPRSLSRSRSGCSLLDRESNTIDFDPDKPLINISDSMANLYSGTSLINRHLSNTVPYTDDLDQDSINLGLTLSSGCPRHHFNDPGTSNASFKPRPNPKDYYNDLLSVYHYPAAHLNCQNNSSSCNNYYECNNYTCYGQGQGQTVHQTQSHNTPHYCHSHTFNHNRHYPHPQYQNQGNGHCSFLQVQPIQPTLTNFNLPKPISSQAQSPTDPSKQKQPMKIKRLTLPIPTKSNNGNGNQPPASKTDSFFVRTKKAIGRAKTAIVSTFSFGGFGHSSPNKGKNTDTNANANAGNVNVPVNETNITKKENKNDKTRGKVPLTGKTKGVSPIRKENSSGYPDPAELTKLINPDPESNRNRNENPLDNASTWTLFPSDYNDKDNEIHPPAILAKAPDPDPGLGPSQYLTNQCVNGINPLKIQPWTMHSSSLDSVHNFDYFYQHYLKDDNKK